jgi:hypothetical protein
MIQITHNHRQPNVQQSLTLVIAQARPTDLGKPPRRSKLPRQFLPQHAVHHPNGTAHRAAVMRVTTS